MISTTNTAASATTTGAESSAAAATSTNTATSTNGKVMGKDDFLQLLVTQLRYQDPLSPEDPKEFVAQLAQFSSLEQQINMNENFSEMSDSLKSLKASQGLGQGVALLGKTVNAAGNLLTISSGTVSTASYQLPKTAKEVKVTVYDASGNSVRVMNLGSRSAGEQVLAWDGKDNQGNKLSDGQYTFKVAAQDSQGNSLEVTTNCSGTVQEVYQDKQGTWLKVNGRPVLLDNIISVGPIS